MCASTDLVPYSARNTGLLGILYQHELSLFFEEMREELKALDLAFIFEPSPLLEILRRKPDSGAETIEIGLFHVEQVRAEP